MFRLSVQYIEDPESKEWTKTAPKLKDDEREHVLIWHNEMAIHANDCRKAFWAHLDETVLRKKDQGRLMMVSDFITAATDSGHLVLSDDISKVILGL